MVALDLQELETFEEYRLIGGFPSDYNEALAMFMRMKAYAEASSLGEGDINGSSQFTGNEKLSQS